MESRELQLQLDARVRVWHGEPGAACFRAWRARAQAAAVQRSNALLLHGEQSPPLHRCVANGQDWRGMVNASC